MLDFTVSRFTSYLFPLHLYVSCYINIEIVSIFLESAIKIAGKGGKKSDKAKSDKPSTAKSGQKSDKKVSRTLDSRDPKKVEFARLGNMDISD